MDNLLYRIKNIFLKKFGSTPLLVSSPGRVNIIGEHTDYNNGFVLPAAINKVILFALAQNNIGRIRLVSTDMEASYYEQAISDPLIKTEISWVNYILGIVDQLKQADKNIQGFDCVFGGNIPIGAGLSSSAALEGGVAIGLNKLFNLKLSKFEIVKLAQRTENEFVGVQCGIMDQFANIFGHKNSAILLDCKTLDYSYVPVKSEKYEFVLCDTQIRRELADSEYNKRRQQCEEGVEILQDTYAEVESLRDVDMAMLNAEKENMSNLIYKRCRYVIEENNRVLESVKYLKKDNYKALGALLFASHRGLRDEYEVSCNELDILAEAAGNRKNVLGARMMGGGFGGCTINLIHVNHKEQFMNYITNHYRDKTGKELGIYTVRVGAGAKIITSNT